MATSKQIDDFTELTQIEANEIWLGKRVMIANVGAFIKCTTEITDDIRESVWIVDDVWPLRWGGSMRDMHRTERLLMTLVNERLGMRMILVLGSEVVLIPGE